MNRVPATAEQHRNYNSRAHHSRLRVLVMLAVGLLAALGVGLLGS